MIKRLHIVIHGAVQGIGFRPFIFRLATNLSLTGWVMNSHQGVFIETEGEKEKLDSFLLRIEKEKPPHSFIQSIEFSFLDPIGFSTFEIKPSDTSGDTTAIVLPDIATCPECLQDIFDSTNRRYLYPFTNCTNCGPRFSIIEALPYDRPNTTMKNFAMCEDCLEEYNNQYNRRFHAQPNACPKCGPYLQLWDSYGKILAAEHEALLLASEAIRSGKIVAMKGLGGFQLIVDARNDSIVNRLRERKHREEKPFALIQYSLDAVKNECEVSELEERLLLSSQAPIVLLKRKTQIARRKSQIAFSVAPNNPDLGIMLPYTPLHHILMRELGFPVVATSGNLSDEPICTDSLEAMKRLESIADFFLVHNRPIRHHVDDSVVRVMTDREMILRRSRGYAPLPIQLHKKNDTTILAVGAHLKNTVALTSKRNVFISQHIGDLETKEAYNTFESVIEIFQTLYNSQPAQVVSDLHPTYLSTQYAQNTGTPLVQIQHHYAHIASCMTENQLDGHVLGVSWDGTGYGFDDTIWGGEFLLTTDTSFQRVATFKQFRLPGGEKAIKEPRRAALGLLYQLFDEKLDALMNLPTMEAFSSQEIENLRRMLDRKINSPLTSSVGRLFDAVASLLGIRQFVSFEGQAAMELEFSAAEAHVKEYYQWSIVNGHLPVENEESSNPTSDIRNPKFIVDWSSMISSILDDRKMKKPLSVIAAKFHNTLVEIIVETAKNVGEHRIVLSGGCFQNKYLTEHTVHRLEAEGFNAYWHQRVPPNDGGIALGQVAAAIRLRM